MRYLLLFLLLSGPLISQTRGKSVLDRDTFPADVKTVTLVNMQFRIDEESYAGDTLYDPTPVARYTIDNRGRTVAVRTYLDDGIVAYDTIWYAGQGKTKYKKSTHPMGNTLEVTTYNEHGQPLSIRTTEGDEYLGQISYAYDGQHRLVKVTNDNSRFIVIDEYSYTEKGDLATSTRTSNENSAPAFQKLYVIRYQYAEPGRLTNTSKTHYRGDQVAWTDSVYIQYDSSGRVRWQKECKGSAARCTSSVFSYTPQGWLSDSSFLVFKTKTTEEIDGSASYGYDAYGYLSSFSISTRYGYNYTGSEIHWYTEYNNKGLPVRCVMEESDAVSIYTWKYTYR
jgi:hypothetical protein